MHTYQGVVAILIIGAGEVQAVDDTNAYVGFASNYVWRGQTRTSDRPAVFGGVAHASDRIRLGIHAFNIEEAGRPPSHEIDVHVNYVFAINTASVDVGAVRYEFPSGYLIDSEGWQIPGSEDNRDFTELTLGVTEGRWAIRYWGSDDYFGTGHWSNYGEINYRYPLGETATLELHYGMKQSRAVPDHAHKVSDFGVRLAKGPMEVNITSLDDNEDGLQSDNARITFAWKQVIDL